MHVALPLAITVLGMCPVAPPQVDDPRQEDHAPMPQRVQTLIALGGSSSSDLNVEVSAEEIRARDGEEFQIPTNLALLLSSSTSR
jgi:hypothetical protein